MTPLYHASRHFGRGLFNALAELGAVRMSPPREPRAAAHRLAGALGTIARAHDIDVRVCGDVPRGPALIVANHVSYLDPIAILPVCPAIPVAKGEVAAWPIVGPIANGLDVVFVRRGDPFARVRTLRRIHDLLVAGAPVLNFPEGTTTNGSRVAHFWRGGFGIAQRLGVPVIPVAIRYADPALAWCDQATFLPHYLQTIRRERVDVALTFGLPIHARPGETPTAMANRARNMIVHMLDTMRWIDAGTSPCLSAPRPDAVLPVTRGA